jgi:hypothetical protein
MSAVRQDRQAERVLGLEQAKEALLDRALELAAERPDVTVPAEDLAPYLHRYYRHIAPEDLVGRRVEDVLGAPLAHRELAASRPQGTASVRVRTPRTRGTRSSRSSATTCRSSSTRSPQSSAGTVGPSTW